VPNQDPRVKELHLGIPLHDWVSAFCTARTRHHHHQRSGNRMGCAELWSVLRFRSWPLRRVSCYTLLSGCQPSWPPTRYLKQPASLNGAHMSLHFDILETISVHPASPVLLTSKGPQKTQAIRPRTPRRAHHPFIQPRGGREGVRVNRGRNSTAEGRRGFCFELHGHWAALHGTAPVEAPAMLPYDFRSLKIGWEGSLPRACLSYIARRWETSAGVLPSATILLGRAQILEQRRCESAHRGVTGL